ncbi:MAG: hypothetical protein AB8G14_04625 [Ilumatobacter sp.]
MTDDSPEMDRSMTALELIWMTAGSVTAVILAMAFTAFRLRGRPGTEDELDGTAWKRAYHLGAELAAGRNAERNADGLLELFDTNDYHVMLASAVAVAARQHPHQIDDVLYRTIEQTELTPALRRNLGSSDTTVCLEALEIIEVLRIAELIGDVAILAQSPDQAIARAACDAVVANDASIGIGILLGMVDGSKTWVLDALGRASSRISVDSQLSLPLAQDQWAAAPMLARRALEDSAMFDSQTSACALSALATALDNESSAMRLASVKALAASAAHPGAQLVLAAALGSADRITRFAAAAALSDSVDGHAILRRVAAGSDHSDAVAMAAEILWSGDDETGSRLHTVAV